MSYRNFVHVSQRTDIPAFGFLPGREVKDAGVGNLGLQDRESQCRIIRLELLSNEAVII